MKLETLADVDLSVSCSQSTFWIWVFSQHSWTEIWYVHLVFAAELFFSWKDTDGLLQQSSTILKN